MAGATAVSDVSGGRGDDTIKVETRAYSEAGRDASASTTITGGSGNDVIDAEISSGSGPDVAVPTRATAILDGGSGNDSLTLAADVGSETAPEPGSN